MYTKILLFLRKFLDYPYCKNIPSKKRVGTRDSWYVILNKLNTNSIVYSGGVGQNITFELELSKKVKRIFLFDPSETGVQTINSIKLPKNIKFYNIGLGKDGIISFTKPKNPDEGSYFIGEGNVLFTCKKISTLMIENNHQIIDLLKIDIEGSEYDVIDDIYENKLNITQICLEFHDFMKPFTKEMTKNAKNKLKELGYTLVHKTMKDYTYIK